MGIRRSRKGDHRSTLRLFVNQQEIDWANLRGALLSQLSARSDWVVFIEGDADLPFEPVAQVINVANELSAKAVLLSDKAKQASR